MNYSGMFSYFFFLETKNFLSVSSLAYHISLPDVYKSLLCTLISSWLLINAHYRKFYELAFVYCPNLAKKSKHFIILCTSDVMKE